MANKKTPEQILSNVSGTGKVTLQIEQEIWNEGEKLSKPHTIVVYPKYLQNEVTNLIALGYTVEFVSQEMAPKEAIKEVPVIETEKRKR